jgi:hypothetical protein
VKGDLSGLAAAGSASPKLQERLKSTGIAEPAWAASPVVFWDLFGRRGFPIRATISDLGPLLLGRLFGLNATQQGVLALVFKVAGRPRDAAPRSEGPPGDAAVCRRQRARVHDPVRQRLDASIGAIQRALLEIEQQGGTSFFGEPMLNVDDLLQTDTRGRGIVNILAAEELVRSPKLYGTFLLWLLSELFEQLPEVGDPRSRRWCSSSTRRTSVRRRAGRAARQDRAGRAPDPLEGCRRLLHHPEPGGRAGRRCSGSWATACSTRCAPSRRKIRRR